MGLFPLYSLWQATSTDVVVVVSQGHVLNLMSITADPDFPHI